MYYVTKEEFEDILSMYREEQIIYLLEVCNVRAIDLMWDILDYCIERDWTVEQIIRDKIEVEKEEC